MSSGLYHLVEAATVLSQLVGSTVHHQQAPTSTSPLSTESVSLPTTSFSRRLSSHTISDDDDMASTKMAALRENHLQALRAAAASASLPSPGSAYTTLAPPATVGATSIQASTLPQNVQVTTTTRVPRSDSKEIFPMKLHALLADPTVRDVISWLPHGKSFVVLRPDVFATRVLPRYFAPEGSNSLNAKKTASSNNIVAGKNKAQGVHKYPSFTRKLNRWGFRQISRGPDAGAFCHELFQRDDPELCRRMICQKSRKSKKSPQHPMVSFATNSGGCYSDDMMSVSSASTMSVKSVASTEKRPYSSTVTVSTAGATSNKSLPFKKRKSGQHIMMNGIPAMISHRNQSMNRASGASWSVTESDLTSSDNGSVSSVNQVAASVAQSVPQAPVAPEASSVARAANTTAAPLSAEAAAREALARHFHEQHRAFALASLMENSRLAMAAVGIPDQQQPEASISVATASSAKLPQHHVAPVLGAMTTHSPSVFAPTVYSAGMNPQPSTAEAAKSALYKAYLQALSSSR